MYIIFVLLIMGASCKDNSNSTNKEKSVADCIVSFEHNQKFEVLTFNIEQFPKSDITIAATAKLLNHINADVVALQEITSERALKTLTDQMEGWSSVFTTEPRYGLSVAYLFKTTEVELIDDYTGVLFRDDTYRFPRAPLVIKVRHRTSGIETILINLHLKAMGDDESVARRRVASNILKEYLDTNHPDDYVIVLGDYNDELVEEDPLDEVYLNFIQDTISYRFADMVVAKGDEENWSYPGWPSHIDHILITDEWFAYLDTLWTIRPEMCVGNYEDDISDHRPVVAVFNFD
jgi:endonuclease/exonuclease/phosphatase family metal-dependent hydrolase